MSAAVRQQQMAQFAGSRQWPWPGKIHAGSNFQMTSPDDRKSPHSLVNPLWAASFWRNADASLKHGAQLAHQQSHATIIPDGLLRWSYGLAPDVSPPAKIDWRRGASRRRRRSNRGSSSEFILSVDDADADGGGGHADGAHDDDGAGNDYDDDDADDGNAGNAGDNDDSAHSFEHNCDHDCQHNDRDDGVHHDGNYDGVDGHRALVERVSADRSTCASVDRCWGT